MKRIILIGICMLLVGCKTLDMTGNFTLGSSGYNHSIAPLEQFCEEINMILFEGSLFQLTGCLDDEGEIHYYKYNYDYNRSLWIIGNKEYEPVWTNT